MGYWLSRLKVNFSAFLRLTFFFSLRLTGVVKINCYCSKKLNIKFHRCKT